MHDAQPLLTWSGYPEGGEIRASDSTLWAEIGGAMLAPDFVLKKHSPPPPRLICPSGSLAGPAFETWGPKGWEAFEARCAEIVSVAGVLVLPRTGDVLSDVQRCLKFLESWGPNSKNGLEHPLGLVVDPSALLTDSMLDRAGEHFERIAELLIPQPGVEAVVVPGEGASRTIAAESWELIRQAAVGCSVALIEG